METGSIINPFRTILAAQTSIDLQIAAGTISPAATNPIFIILSGSTSENVALTKGHIYLVGNNSSIHSPIYLTGVESTVNTTVSISGSAATLDANHFAITGLSIVAPPGGKAISGIGTNPQRIFLKDVWITASGTTGTGFYQDNTGTGSITHGSDIKVSHSGSGDVYCFNIVKGTATFSTVETSGATQVGAAQSGARLLFTQSELDANGDCVLETYGNGRLEIVNSYISNAAANSNGIKINGEGSIVVLGNVTLDIPVGVGTTSKAVWYNPSSGLSSSYLAYSNIVFPYIPGTLKNNTVDTRLQFLPQASLTGGLIVPSVTYAIYPVSILNALYPPGAATVGMRAFAYGTVAGWGTTVTNGISAIPVYCDGGSWRIG